MGFLNSVGSFAEGVVKGAGDLIGKGAEKAKDTGLQLVEAVTDAGKIGVKTAGAIVEGTVIAATLIPNIFVELTQNQSSAGAAPASEEADAGSVLVGVDLFNLDSLEDAIGKAQDLIAEGGGGATLFQELQLLLNAQMQMVSLISNSQKVQHDTAMAAINNIR